MSSHIQLLNKHIAPMNDANTLTAEVISPAELTAAQIGHWDALCSSVPHLRNPYLSAHFTRTMAAIRPHVQVCVLRRGASVAGFYPFQFRSSIHKQLRIGQSVGEYMAGYSGLVVDPGLRIEPEKLLRLCGLVYLRAFYLEESQLSYGLSCQKQERGLLIRLDDGPKAYWSDLRKRDKRFVAETERRQRQLEQACGPLHLSVIAPGDTGPHLEQLIERKRQQFRRTNKPDALGTRWKRDLLTKLAAQPGANCESFLSVLHAGSTWVASQFALRHGGSIFYYFPVYNPELARYSPGRMMLKAIIDASEELGINVIDRCAGDTPAKRDFATDSHSLYSGAWHRPGVRSLLYRAGCSVGWKFLRAVEHLD